MMKITFAVVLFSLVCIALASQTPTVTTPALFWSNKGFLGDRDQTLEVLTTDKLVKSIFSKSVNPEVIVLFVEPELSTKEFSALSGAYEQLPNGGSFSNLKRLIETSSSSKVAPYVHGIYQSSLIGTSIASDVLSSLAQSSTVNVFVASDSVAPSGFSNPRTAESVSNLNIQKISIAELKQNLQSNWEILSNGKTDVVVVYLDAQYKADDEFVGSVCSMLAVPYVAVFTGETAESVLTTSVDEMSGLYYKDSSDDSGDDSNWPPEIVEALLVMIPYILILLVGVCCSFQIQSELKFDAEKPKRA